MASGFVMHSQVKVRKQCTSETTQMYKEQRRSPTSNPDLKHDLPKKVC